MKTLALMKKDLLISKRTLVAVLLSAIVFPLLVAVRMPQLIGFFSFLLMAIFCVVILNLTISLEEMKYPKAIALLCSMPYSRKNYVTAKYALFLALLIYCGIVYNLLSLFMPNMAVLSMQTMLLALFFISVFWGVYIPIEIRFGAKNTQFLALAILLIIVFMSPSLAENGINAPMSLMHLSVGTINIILAVLCTVILILSWLVSLLIFSRKEL